MKSERSCISHRTAAIVAPILALAAVFTCLGLAVAVVAGQDGQKRAKEYEDFDPKTFERPTLIDNKWFPLKPGKRFVYEGSTI